MYRLFSVLWALKISRSTFSFALAFLVLYVFLCLASVFAIFVHAFHLYPFSFFPLGLRCFARLFLHISWLKFSQVKKTTATTTTTTKTALLFQTNVYVQRTYNQLIRSHNRSGVVNECRKCSRETQHYKTPKGKEE